MKKLSFGSKADTLAVLRPILKSAVVLPQVSFTVGQWRDEREKTIERVFSENWAGGPLIVRSSCGAEDGAGSTQAGKFLSALDVPGEREALLGAVEDVIASYENPGPEDQVFVQPMLGSVSMSGVAFGRDPNTGAPYVVINYDDETGDPSSVTSGRFNNLKSFYCWKRRDVDCEPRLAKVLELVEELEGLFGTDSVDLEFAFDAAGVLYLLQARRLPIARKPGSMDRESHEGLLEILEEKIRVMSRPHPYLSGARAVYGVMPDWNPAEVIGVRPKPLALSLYKNLVTDSTWAYQRNNYGYKNLRSFPLMHSFHGLPYVDVRVSFNSFVPQGVDGGLAERLVNYYLDRLLKTPAHHDKIEFEIVFSCYTLDLPRRLEALKEHGFSSADLGALAESLRRLTNSVIRKESSLISADKERLRILDEHRRLILGGDLDPVSRIYWLLEDCRRYGTLPFAGLARAGFIAVQMLHSLVSLGILREDEKEAFLAGINTVTARMKDDFETLPKEEFLARYGHLRPGSYNIESARYDEAPDRYFDWSKKKKAPTRSGRRFELSPDQARSIDALLESHGLEVDAFALLDFMEESIRGREEAKFMFTKNLSDALSLFRDFGAARGFSVEDLSFADITCIHRLYTCAAPARELLRASIEEGMESYSRMSQIILPPVISGPEDVWAFHMPSHEPSYITQKTVVGPVRRELEGADLRGAIVMIKNADPGYDWIFSKDVAGLITAYGGVNSHMAIRAGEFGLPAVIGAGETLFQRWSMADRLRIDCANRRVEVFC